MHSYSVSVLPDQKNSWIPRFPYRFIPTPGWHSLAELSNYGLSKRVGSAKDIRVIVPGLYPVKREYLTRLHCSKGCILGKVPVASRNFSGFFQ